MANEKLTILPEVEIKIKNLEFDVKDNKKLKLPLIAEKDNIKGVLIDINSPGGAVAPSIELAYAIKELNKIKINVKSDFTYGFESSSETANIFGSYFAKGDIKPLLEYEDKINKLSVEKLMDMKKSIKSILGLLGCGLFGE